VVAGLKTVSILGATGSVGRSTADVILSQPEAFKVHAVTANSNADALAELAIKLKAQKAVVADDKAFPALKEALAGTNIKALSGPDQIEQAAADPADIVMAGIVGMAGLMPVLRALEQGTHVAIANKEPLVAAGALVMEMARKHGATILPVDSEHNAVFQVFEAEHKQSIERIILTASGGPFRTWTAEQMAQATPQQAVAHPNWSMGAKISVDSATMMNKALEVIEAHYLFGLPPEKIDVIVHPQSTVHSMVEYNDGSVLAQLGAPDMRTPIAYALAWPERMATPGRRLDWKALRHLDFEPADAARFPAIAMAYDALRSGPWACAALNAANEIAVAAFLAGRIGFTDIVEVSRRVLADIQPLPLPGLEDIIAFDASVRRRAEDYIIGQNAKRRSGTGS
jgi:1-deoxy-D-xylulose-5-phosphate reductoisomerase